MSADYEKELINKKSVFKDMTNTKNATKITLISAKGTSGTAHMGHISEVLTLDDLFLPL